MATYEDLDTLIGTLKRAAIDSYMCSGGDWSRYDTYYGKHYFDEYGSGEKVTRPGENGEGGGSWSGTGTVTETDVDYGGRFDQVRSAVDSHLGGGWLVLPKPDRVEHVVQAMRGVNSTLSVGAVISGGQVTGGGTIAGNINLILENSDEMAGGMITAFKADFLAQLSKAIGGQHAITVILGGALAAQKEMWVQGRQSVADIVVQATESFDASAAGSQAGWDVLLKVAGYAVAGVSIFATGGAATGLAVAGLGLTILQASVPGADAGAETSAADSQDYGGVLSAFETSLRELEEGIAQEEQTLHDNFTTNLSQIRADRDSYDIPRPPLIDIDDGSDLGTPEELRIDHVLVKEITRTFMPNIADELDVALVQLEDTSDLESLLREGGIGIGVRGPSEKYHELRYLLEELIGNLSAEVRWSAETLQLAVEDIGQADTDAEDALERHRRQVGESSAPDPWNVVRVPPNI